MDVGWLALAEDSDGDEDVEFDHGSELSLSKLPLKNLVDSDDEDDDEDDDEEGERPLKDLFSFDDEDDDEDDDKEGAPAEQPAKKKKKKLPVAVGALKEELDDAPVRDGFFEEEAVESEFDDAMFDTDSSMSDTGSVDLPPEYVDAGMSDEQDVDYEPIEDVSKRRRKRPLKDFVYSDDEADDEDDDEEGEPAEQPAKKKTTKLPVSSAEAVAEKVPERGIPADEPAGKKKRTRCPVCGVWSTQLARHIMAKHQDWSKVKAQNVRYANIETKRKRFECPTCLTRVVNLKRHLVQMHDVQPGSMQELHLLALTSKRAQTKLKVGSSGMMEVEAARVLWRHSVERYKLCYTVLLSDGDAKTFTELTNIKPYGDEVHIEKEECINHSLIWSRCAKDKFASRWRVQFAVFTAISEFNFGPAAAQDTASFFGFHQGAHLKRLGASRQKKRERNSVKFQKDKANKRRDTVRAARLKRQEKLMLLEGGPAYAAGQF
ncbi:hypothetical protein ACOMHN_030589 [Nucella lapillus]